MERRLGKTCLTNMFNIRRRFFTFFEFVSAPPVVPRVTQSRIAKIAPTVAQHPPKYRRDFPGVIELSFPTRRLQRVIREDGETQVVTSCPRLECIA